MAPRDTKSEAFQAGQENPYIGAIKPLQFLNALPSAIGAEISGSDMGTPVGTKFKAQLKQSGAYAKRLEELRAKHPEEFGRGQMLAQEAADPYEFGLGLGTLGGMTPYGRTTFEMAGGGESPEGIFRNPELGFRPRGRGPGPEGRTINAGFDVPRGMNRYQTNQYYMTHGIPGDEIYYRSNPPMPYPTSRNAFEEASVLAANRTRPSPAPANYDYQGPSMPGAMTDRPVSGFDRNMLDWARAGRTPPGRTGAFRPEDFAPYSPEEMGQGVALRGSTMPMPQRGGMPMMARGGEIPYGEFRDVTGNVLRGQEGQGAGGPIPMGASMATRMGEGAYRYEPSIASRMGYGAYQYEPVAAAPRGGIPMFAYPAAAAGFEGAKSYFDRGPAPSGTVGQPQLGPYDFGMMPGPQGMETMQGFRNYGPPMPPQGGGARRGGAQRAADRGVPMPPRRPAELSQPQQGQFEGNFNYDVTRAIDALLGQDQAEAGRHYQEYYANNPWPY